MFCILHQAFYLRLGFSGQPGQGGEDLRHDIAQLVALYRPYKQWLVLSPLRHNVMLHMTHRAAVSGRLARALARVRRSRSRSRHSSDHQTRAELRGWVLQLAQVDAESVHARFDR